MAALPRCARSSTTATSSVRACHRGRSSPAPKGSSPHPNAVQRPATTAIPSAEVISLRLFCLRRANWVGREYWVRFIDWLSTEQPRSCKPAHPGRPATRTRRFSSNRRWSTALPLAAAGSHRAAVGRRFVMTGPTARATAPPAPGGRGPAAAPGCARPATRVRNPRDARWPRTPATRC